jgi:hypothetical protein
MLYLLDHRLVTAPRKALLLGMYYLANFSIVLLLHLLTPLI